MEANVCCEVHRKSIAICQGCVGGFGGVFQSQYLVSIERANTVHTVVRMNQDVGTKRLELSCVVEARAVVDPLSGGHGMKR